MGVKGREARAHAAERNQAAQRRTQVATVAVTVTRERANAGRRAQWRRAEAPGQPGPWKSAADCNACKNTPLKCVTDFSVYKMRH